MTYKRFVYRSSTILGQSNTLCNRIGCAGWFQATGWCMFKQKYIGFEPQIESTDQWFVEVFVYDLCNFDEHIFTNQLKPSLSHRIDFPMQYITVYGDTLTHQKKSFQKMTTVFMSFPPRLHSKHRNRCGKRQFFCHVGPPLGSNIRDIPRCSSCVHSSHVGKNSDVRWFINPMKSIEL